MKTRPFIFSLLMLLCCPSFALADDPASAVNGLAAADANGGYAGQVLAKVSREWNPPPDTLNRRVAVRLHIDGEGNLNECALMTPSDMPEMNKAACGAARAAGNFGVPPYGMPIEVHMTFWTGKPSRNRYADRQEDKQAAKAAEKPVEKAAPPQGKKIEPVDTGKAASPAKAEPAGRAVPVPGKPVVPEPVKQIPAKQESLKQEPTRPARPEAPNASPARKLEQKAEQKPAVSRAVPEPKPEQKPEQKQDKSRKAGVLDNADAATTPVKTAGNGAPATPKPEKQAKPERQAKPETQAKPEKSGAAEKAEKGKPQAAKADPAAKGAIRTQFAPYRDPKAKPEPEKPAPVTEQQQRYAAEVSAWVQPRIRPPDKLPKGKYTVGVTLAVSATGEVMEAAVARSSGQAALDEAVLRALLRAETLSPPPGKQAQELKLTLTVQKP